jgi:hypothetical protein
VAGATLGEDTMEAMEGKFSTLVTFYTLVLCKSLRALN